MFEKEMDKILFDIKSDIKFIEKYIYKTNYQFDNWLLETAIQELTDSINNLWSLIET